MSGSIESQLSLEKSIVEKLLRSFASSSSDQRSLAKQHLKTMRELVLRFPNEDGDLVIKWFRIIDHLDGKCSNTSTSASSHSSSHHRHLEVKHRPIFNRLQTSTSIKSATFDRHLYSTSSRRSRSPSRSQ